ncbi:hypothetical protein CAL7716_106400 (plasmid) [Calothrix sp. PCC 7716]|nr:hypothetical protein CAL7716_106400 [Calothrix sp. PCC 7716]
MDNTESNESNLHHDETINIDKVINHVDDKKISRNISQIIQRRQHLANRVQPVYQNLRALLTEIQHLNQHRQEIKTTLDNFEAKESLDEINLLSIEKSICQEIFHLEQLQQRFSRSTLNIGVVGWTGQGKSTFLKSFSGLTDNEIPALPGGACTAVRSTIQHSDGDTHAIVTFHSETSFLQEVIAPYYEKLSLGNPPANLDEFANLPFPNLPNDETTTKQTMYNHLRNDYYLPLNNYRNLLQAGKPRQVKISKDAIKNYVIQQRNEKNLLTTFNHLAVREVKILCRFVKTEVSLLGLVDVPGLGDTRLGDEDLMLETLGREVDIVMFLRRPDSVRYFWEKRDNDLYDIVSKALPNFSNRAFLVLNHKTTSSNFKACQSLRKNLGEMKFVMSEIADCNNPDEAHRILELILQYLDKHIEELELRYAKSCQDSLIRLYYTIESDLGKAQNAMKQFTQENKLFRRLFDDFKRNLSNGLRDLVEELAQEQNLPDPDFEAVVTKALEACENETVIPSEEEIRNRARSLGLHNSYKATYCVLIAELRAHLSKNFLSLDNGLQQAANQLKVRIAKVLIEQSGLSNLTDATGAAFLERVTEMLVEQGKYSELELGFRTLVEFNISYGALILQSIRQNLMSVLQPDEIIKNHELTEATAQTPKLLAKAAIVAGVSSAININPQMAGEVINVTDKFANAVLDSAFDFNPETVRANLQQLHQQALSKCQETLKGWVKAPSKIRYYMATEFVDRVLDAEEMEAEWDEFLREPEIRSKVWVEFSRIEKMKQVHQSWQDALRKVLSMSQRKQFEFLR